MALNYNHLYYFHVAAVEGSVAGAAQRLGVTAATVSEQLRTLERALAHELFERTQTGLKLTDVGRICFEHTAPMFKLGERLMGLLAKTEEQPPLPPFRVGVSIGAARATTARFIARLLSLADCAPTIRTCDTIELVRDLRGGLLDLVLCESPPADGLLRGLKVTELARSPLVAIASPQFTPAPDWRDARAYHYRPTSSYRRDVDTYLDAQNLHPMHGGEADDAFLLIEAAAIPGHIAIVPSSLATDAIANGRVRILREVEPAFAALHALYPDTAPARRAVELLAAT